VSVSPNPSVNITAENFDISVQIIQEINALSLTQEAPIDVSIPAVGIQGPRGYSMLSGSGVPDSELGINNDLYVNLANGFLYKKILNAWEFKFNIFPQFEKITITQQMVDDNGLHLSVTPLNPSAVSLAFVGGVGDQDNGEDFSVSGDFVGWSGLGLDGFIEVGDVLKIRY
jgi:hypothetical protein